MKSSACNSWMRRLGMSVGAFLLTATLAIAQTKTVTGTIVDNLGEPVIGANVIVKGTTLGATTDIDGNFSISGVADNADLVVSFMGYTTQTVSVAGKNSINVTLSEDATSLEDVVVVGYGTMKRKDLTGSVASVTGDNLTKNPVANVAEALQGQLGGVNIMAQDGRPGASMSIRVRGGGSITQSNEPLYIVDGVAVSSIDDIAADNIESIDVLKDASSTAIYGARGANGVILVTTKGAKEGNTTVKYNMYYQLKAKPELQEMMNAYDYVRSTWEYQTAFGYGDKIARYYGLGSANGNNLEKYRDVSSHNYMDDVFQSANMWNHDLSVSGGTDKTKYYTSVNYTSDGATMLNSGYDRWNVNLKLQQKIIKTLTLDVDARYSATSTQYNRFFSGSHANNTLIYPWQFNPIDNPLGNGATTEFGDGSRYAEKQYNPIDVINDNDYTRKQQRIRVNTSLTWNVLKSLTAKTELSLSRHWTKTQTWTGPNTGRDLVSSAKLGQGDGYSTAWTSTLNYDFSDLITSKNHSLSLLLGNEVLTSRSNSSTIYGYRYPSAWDKNMAFGQIMMYQDKNQSYSTYNIGVPSHTISWFSRLNYNLFGRYMLTATFRADGSSKFADGNRWGYFPAGAIAWRISDESWMESAQSWLDNLKLRLSFGISGNDGIDANAFIDAWESKQDPTTGLFSYNLGSVKGNPDLTWEKTTSRNVGLDYSFKNGKFNGSLDFYWNTTSDCLMLVPISLATGRSYQYQNAAKTENKGIEVSFNYNIVETKNFNLSFGVNYNYNVNKIKEVADANMGSTMTFASTSMNPQTPYVILKNEPVGIIMGYQADGFYGVDDFDFVNGQYKLKSGVKDCNVAAYTTGYSIPDGQKAFPGMPKYKDVDEDGKIDTKDVTIIGRMKPQHTGGFRFNGKYKQVDFSLNFAYQLDGKVFNANYARSLYSGGADKNSAQGRLASRFDNSWKMYKYASNGDIEFVNDPDELRKMNEGTAYGTLAYVNDLAPVVSDDYIESAAYLRLQSLTIGWSLPKEWIKKAGMSNARLYFTAGNLFTIKGYDGLDPDVNTDSSMSSSYSGFPTPGYDYIAYPRSRTFTFGVNLAF